MKKELSILLILTFGFAFGQVEEEIVEEEMEEMIVTSIHWISEKCSDLTNTYENSKCVRKEIENFVNRKADWSIINKLPKDKYIIRIKMMVEIDGEITYVKAFSGNNVLNNEFERIMMMFQNRIKMVDQNGNIHRNNANFPLTIQVE